MMFGVMKRYKMVAILVFLCFFSAFLSLCNGLLSTSKASSMIKERNQYAYSNSLRVFISPSENISPKTLFQLVDSVEECNIYVDDVPIYFDEVDGLYNPKVILKQNESLSLPVKRNINSLPEGSIVISSNIVGKLSSLSVKGEKFSIYDKIDVERYPYATGLIDSIFLMAGLLLSIAVASFVVMIVPVRVILSIQPSEGVKL